MNIPDQRRSKRFDLNLPFELVRAGTRQVSEAGETWNVSSAGVLFSAPEELEIGAPIEYFITLPSGSGGKKSIRLHCVGRVVRRHHAAGRKLGNPVAMAATLERYEFIRPSTGG